MIIMQNVSMAKQETVALSAVLHWIHLNHTIPMDSSEQSAATLSQPDRDAVASKSYKVQDAQMELSVLETLDWTMWGRFEVNAVNTFVQGAAA